MNDDTGLRDIQDRLLKGALILGAIVFFLIVLEGWFTNVMIILKFGWHHG
jgi:hypothetical protein